MALNPKERFGDRVADYIRARPSYPPAALDQLASWGLLPSDAHIADIGAGTGIFTRLLLERGVRVTAVEPNGPMRAAIGDHDSLTVLDGDSGSTGLHDNSVTAITAAQAFHWFDLQATGPEFRRILKPGGKVCLLWNDREAGTAFNADYEQFLDRWGTDYLDVQFRNGPNELRDFFESTEWVSFPNEQWLDLEGLQARICSCSYIPEVGHPNREPMIAALPELFEAHAQDGEIVLSYRTTVILGTL